MLFKKTILSDSTQHIICLDDLIDSVKFQTKMVKKRFLITASEARTHLLRSYGFNNDYEYQKKLSENPCDDRFYAICLNNIRTQSITQVVKDHLRFQQVYFSATLKLTEKDSELFVLHLHGGNHIEDLINHELPSALNHHFHVHLTTAHDCNIVTEMNFNNKPLKQVKYMSDHGHKHHLLFLNDCLYIPYDQTVEKLFQRQHIKHHNFHHHLAVNTATENVLQALFILLHLKKRYTFKNKDFLHAFLQTMYEQCNQQPPKTKWFGAKLFSIQWGMLFGMILNSKHLAFTNQMGIGISFTAVALIEGFTRWRQVVMGVKTRTLYINALQTHSCFARDLENESELPCLILDKKSEENTESHVCISSLLRAHRYINIGDFDLVILDQTSQFFHSANFKFQLELNHNGSIKDYNKQTQMVMKTVKLSQRCLGFSSLGAEVYVIEPHKSVFERDIGLDLTNISPYIYHAFHSQSLWLGQSRRNNYHMQCTVSQVEKLMSRLPLCSEVRITYDDDLNVHQKNTIEKLCPHDQCHIYWQVAKKTEMFRGHSYV
jgi:hypothetical protein